MSLICSGGGVGWGGLNWSVQFSACTHYSEAMLLKGGQNRSQHSPAGFRCWVWKSVLVTDWMLLFHLTPKSLICGFSRPTNHFTPEEPATLLLNCQTVCSHSNSIVNKPELSSRFILRKLPRYTSQIPVTLYNHL